MGSFLSTPTKEWFFIGVRFGILKAKWEEGFKRMVSSPDGAVLATSHKEKVEELFDVLEKAIKEGRICRDNCERAQRRPDVIAEVINILIPE